ncbi:MAG TPA: efflux RND transporter periplasmic adaptor subunit [Bacteroidales bacterium]|nr:efflux RND transporter periplasmic adaptor subunit [Bacteroidales bacterium]
MKRDVIFFILGLLILSFINIACQNNEGVADAYGVIEAKEIIVSSEVNGLLLHFPVEEGAAFSEGDPLGFIDTTQLYLQIMQLNASINAALAKRPDMPIQIRSLQDKMETLENEKLRIKNLISANAASTQQLDEINAEINITQSQIDAIKSTLSTTNNSILEEVEAIRYQKLQLQSALSKCFLKAPISGTLMKKYIEENELAYQGKPLFKMADLSQMYIRVYVTEDQLSNIKIGQKAEIRIDQQAGEHKKFTGVISWISPKAEFTPKMIQTKKERVNLVYAVKVNFINDGSAKIGMPGDLIFK